MTETGSASFKAAVVQMRSGVDPAANLEQMTRLVREAASAGADYIQTPEMTGLVQQQRKPFFETVRTQSDDVLVKAASALAKELGITLHIGSTAIRLSDTKAANRAFLFGPDGVLIETYDKMHMFDVDLDNGESWRESAVYQPGEAAKLVDVCGAKTGLAICYDCRFPALHLAYALAGAEVLTGPSCFTRQTGEAHWHVLLRSRAIENGAYMIAAAQGGAMEDGRETFGHSIIIAPWGRVIAEVEGDEPGFAIADIDTAQVAAARAKIPNLRNQQDITLVDAVTRTGALPERAA